MSTGLTKTCKTNSLTES